MTVYLVGTGPGDPELLTVKALRLIRTADVLIYDKLVNKEILDRAPPGAKLYYVGKREGSSESSGDIQRRINELLEGHGPKERVVRLKGGDPVIFGRGGEEAQVCARAGIPFEIVPGISSAFAVPAYAGIPITHRDINSSFAVITGHEADKERSAIEWDSLPDNVVILMGVAKIKVTARRLLDGGRDPETPVAAIHRGTTPFQRTEIHTLRELAEGGVGSSPPVVFVVGPAVTLHDSLDWFGKKLERARGKRVVLTLAEGHEAEGTELLGSYGMRPASMPLIEIVSRQFRLPSPDNFDALVFTSREGVERAAEEVGLGDFEGSVFAIGPKTREAARHYRPDVSIGERFDSAGLAEHISDELEEGSRILALRSSRASSVLRGELSGGYDVTEIPVYDVKPLSPDPEVLGEADAVFLASAVAAGTLRDLDPALLRDITLVAIGPNTSRNIEYPHIIADTHTVAGMVKAYFDHLWGGSV